MFWAVGTVLILVVAVVIATPWIVRAVVPQAFAGFGMHASVNSGSLSLLRRELTLEGLSLGEPNEPLISLGELGIALEFRALLEGRVKLSHLRIKDVSLNVERLLALRNLDTSASTPGQQGLPVELDELELEDVRLASVAERIGHDVRIVRLSISDLSALLAGKQSSLGLQAAIGHGSVDLQLQLTLEKDDLRATGKFHLDKVPLRGWAGLASQQTDPISEGLVNGRGNIKVGYATGTKSVDLDVDGRIDLESLGVNAEPVNAERGDAAWQGRLGLRWAPDFSTPKLRGTGVLDVDALHLLISEASQAPVRAVISDFSWQGDFDWQDGLTSEGALRGTRLDVGDASSKSPAWQLRADDLSWRLNARAESGSGTYGIRVQEVDLARLSITVAAADAPVDIAIEKLAVDEMRAAQSGDVVLGLATVDTLTVTEVGGPDGGDAIKLRAEVLATTGLSGDFSGKLQVAKISAASFDYTGSGKKVRAEGIDFASVGFRAPLWVGVGELGVKSMRADAGQGDIWLSGLTVTKSHGDGSGRFAAEAVAVTRLFQSGSSKLSWDASKLTIRGIQGDATDTAQLSAIELGELKIGIDDASWEGSGLHSSNVAVAMSGDVKVASLGFARLERRQPGTGDMRIAGLGASAFHLRDEQATLEDVKAARFNYTLNQGEGYEARALQARGLGGDLKNGLQTKHFSAAGASGHFAGGAHFNTTDLDIQRLSVAVNGEARIGQAGIQRFDFTGADASKLDLQQLSVGVARWKPGGHLSADQAAIRGAHFVHTDGVRWELAQLDAKTVKWERDGQVSAAAATLTSANQSRGKSKIWQANELRAADFHLSPPGEVQVATLAAQSVEGGAGPPAWKVTSVHVKGLGSSQGSEHKFDVLESGAVTVTDTRNGALVSLQRAQVEAARQKAGEGLSADKLLVKGLQVRSEEADWPSRLTAADVMISKSLLRTDGGLDLGSVVVRNPYLIVGRASDKSWMWPPLPGAGNADDRKDDSKVDEKQTMKTHASGGIRLASFITRGMARIAYVDRVTDPPVHLILDPVVVAIENLDTRRPGSVALVRARGTGARYSGFHFDSKLKTRVGGTDLGLTLVLKGVDLPELNPYIIKREPLVVTAGRADARNDIKIENHLLDGNVDLLLAGLEVKSALGGGKFTRIDPLNFPIRTAVALLKDRQGNISLTVPMRERTDSPKFDVVTEFQNDFVRTITAAGKVAADLPGKTLDRALELLDVTVSMLPGMGAESYAPIRFEYGVDNLSAVPLVYLDQLGSRMSSHESLSLALCGRAVPEDEVSAVGQLSNIDKLFAEASKGVFHVYQPGRDGLLALAEARADLIRRFLRNVYKISEHRLSSCDPLIDDQTGAQPRVELQVKTPAGSTGFFRRFF